MATSKIYADHVAAFKMFADYVAANGDTYGFSTEDQTTIASELVTLNTAYANYQDTTNVTRVFIEVMRRRYDETDKILRFQRLRLKTSGINLPAEAVLAFGVHVDSERRGRVEPPTFAPEVVIQKLVHLVSRLNAIDSRSGSERYLGKPDDADSIAIYVCYVASGSPVPEREQYAAIPDSGRTVFNITHTSDKVGMICYVITAYRNRRGVSPESVPISFPVF